MVISEITMWWEGRGINAVDELQQNMPVNNNSKLFFLVANPFYKRKVTRYLDTFLIDASDSLQKHMMDNISWNLLM